MADSKDYSATSGKKILFIIAVLVFIGVVITAIVLLIPTNKYSMVNALQENQQTFFLKDENEQSKFNSFTDKIKSNANINYYSDEINDIPVIASTMAQVLDYYNDYMVFAENNKVMTDNNKIINNKIELSVKIKNNINDILDKTTKLEVNSDSFLQNAWIDFRKEFNDYIKCYYDMFESLKNCYEGCFDVTLSNNKASHHVLQAANDYITCLNSDFNVLINVDRKGSIEQGNYMYKSHGKVEFFTAFVSNCIENNGEIIHYLISDALQQKYQKLDKFLQTYNETDYKTLINSIYPSSITKTYDVVDTEGLYVQAVAFLDRR